MATPSTSNYDKYAEIQNKMQGRHGFYVASNDHELLRKVTSIVDSYGYVGLMDTAGRVHYLVDGRKGSPYAARKIKEVAGRLISMDKDLEEKQLELIQLAVDKILKKEHLSPHLKGYRYLRFMLQQSAVDSSLLRPITKTLYPDTAKYFRVKPSQIERDIRYAIKSCCKPPLQGYSNTLAVCYLHDLISLYVLELQKKEIHNWENRYSSS